MSPIAARVSADRDRAGAWTTVAGFAPTPSIPTGPASPPAQGFSLLAIQQEERDYANRSMKPAPRSFAQIQEEEKKAIEERAKVVQQQSFESWFDQQARTVVNERGRGGRGRGGRNSLPKRARGRGGGQASANRDVSQPLTPHRPSAAPQTPISGKS